MTRPLEEIRRNASCAADISIENTANAFFDLIAGSLVEGKDVKISGFGNFQIRTKAPRPGRNPRTGEAIPIEARRVVTFHASHKLKEQIQGSGNGEAGQD